MRLWFKREKEGKRSASYVPFLGLLLLAVIILRGNMSNFAAEEALTASFNQQQALRTILQAVLITQNATIIAVSGSLARDSHELGKAVVELQAVPSLLTATPLPQSPVIHSILLQFDRTQALLEAMQKDKKEMKTASWDSHRAQLLSSVTKIDELLDEVEGKNWQILASENQKLVSSMRVRTRLNTLLRFLFVSYLLGLVWISTKKRKADFEKETVQNMNRLLEQKVKDRTEQLLNAEAKLVHSAKMVALGEMAGGVAHQINSPLGTIKLLGEQLQEVILEESVERKVIAEMANTIAQTSARIGTIVESLKAFSGHSGEELLQSVPVARVFAQTMLLCHEKLKNSGIQVLLDVPPSDLRVRCRETEISQVILNLINNSSEAIGALPEKWMEISAEEVEGMVQISVTDSGAGIPSPLLEKIFQPFFSTKEIGKGTGLGLSVAKGIVEAHNGKLAVDAQSPNTKFIIMLPKSPALASAA